MHEELYSPITDLDKYLNRISIEKSKESSIDYLDELILAHQLTVPFENIDIIEFKKNIEISTEGIFDKIVNNRRGGYCFELNAIFHKLLVASGFDAYPCLARVVAYGETSVPSLHRLTIIRDNNELYVCDVGFGGAQPCFALKLEDGETKTSKKGLEQTFKIEESEGWWTIKYLSNDSWNSTIKFMPMELPEVEFIAPNYFCSTSDESAFRFKRMVNLKTALGNKSIADDTFIQIENHDRKELPINNKDELFDLLEIHFGIKIN